jgi:type II secretory pathway pseudopilin PulG
VFHTGKHAFSAPPSTRTLRGPHGPNPARQPAAYCPVTIQRLRARLGYAPDDAGFTLIEAIVSFAIFAIVITAAVLAIVGGISASNNNRDRVTAANVAQQALARAQALPAASLTATPTATITNTVGAEPYTITRAIDFRSATPGAAAPATATACPAALNPGTASWIHIAVTVTWPGSHGHNVAMDTVRSC